MGALNRPEKSSKARSESVNHLGKLQAPTIGRKLQAPTSKHQRNSKIQASNTRSHATVDPGHFACVGLEFGCWSFSGAWMLVLGVFLLLPHPIKPRPCCRASV